MGNDVYVLAQIYDAFVARGIDPQQIRDEFSNYKQGGEYDHDWFCHDVGADSLCYLRHVHFIPTDDAAAAEWQAKFEDKNRKKHRTSDRYILYASDARHGHLIIDILDDPGAHALWATRGQKLKSYENAAADFCTFGPKSQLHK